MYSVVIVEDDPIITELNRRYVEKDGRFGPIQCFAAPRAALDWLRRHPADLVILDFSDNPEDDFQFASEAERASHINIGMSVQKGNTVLLEAMNDVLSTMTEDDFTELMNQAVSVQPEI